MNNNSLIKLFSPAFLAMALLLGSSAGAFQQTSAMERLINACEQELQTICSRLDEPNEAIMCLTENEPQLQTQTCVDEVEAYNREQRQIPKMMEQPFRYPVTNEIQ